MGIFKNIFGGNTGEKPERKQDLPWIPLVELTQLDCIHADSFSRPQLIYKHSTTCGISSMVLNMFSKSYDFSEEQADLYFLDLHRHRAMSNEVAGRLGVRHESPQLIVVDKGEVIVHRSHGGITDLHLDSYL